MTHPDTAIPSIDASDPEFQASLTKAIYDTIPDGILVVNEHGLVVFHNAQFLNIWKTPAVRITGLVGDSVIGSSDAPLLAAVLERVKDPKAFLARVRELYADLQLDDHCEIELKDGRTLERHSTVLRNSEGQYLGRVWFFRDITPQKQAAAALLEITRHDPLTGIANRRYFFERAQQEFARARRRQASLAIASFDIDHFKQINDSHGHAAGDEVLKSLCDNCQNFLRETELFARIGGEEFTILLPDTSLHGATQLAERLRRATEQIQLRYNEQDIALTLSIGVTVLKPTDQSIEDCLRRSDHAMYRAKQNGRNRVEAVA